MQVLFLYLSTNIFGRLHSFADPAYRVPFITDTGMGAGFISGSAGKAGMGAGSISGSAGKAYMGLGTAKVFHIFVPHSFLNIPEFLGIAAGFV